MEPVYKLSVVVLIYNHENYIKQALDSILMQKVDFEYEVIVLEDCSTDNTRDIILKYKNKFKNIKLLFNKKNYGGDFTIRAGVQHVEGQYFAILEGDDYWTANNKLQQQVDFLDEHLDFVGCAHNTELFYMTRCKKELLISDDNIKSVFNVRDLISGACYFHTTSYVWRNNLEDVYPKEMFYNHLMGDWFLSMLYSRNGPIKYINKIMSVYRITGNGAWTKLPQYQQMFNNIRGMYLYNKLLDYKYNEEFKKHLSWVSKHLIKTIPKNYTTCLTIIKLILLLKSLDIPANRHLSFLFKITKSALDKYLSGKLTQSKIYICCFKVLVLLGQIVDKTLMTILKILFDCLYLFDINRYYLYYKIRIYEFLGINLYKENE